MDDAFAFQRLPLRENRGRVVRVEEIDHRVEAACGVAAHHGRHQVDHAAIAAHGQADEPRVIGKHAICGERVVGLAKHE